MKVDLIIGLVCLVLAAYGVVIKKVYFALPEIELKRRAEQHDKDAVVLYKAVAYGNSLRAVLWLYIGLTAAASFILLAKSLPLWLSILIVGPLLWIAFSLLPSGKVGRVSMILTKLSAPLVASLLNLVNPVVDRGANAASNRYHKHTGLFERNDLFDLIEKQKSQSDSRITDEELEVIKRVLSFSDWKVRDILTPRKKVKAILADDTVGPILIDELHKSKQESVLVKESKKGPIIGTLAFKGLGLDSKGKVKDLMDDKLYYLHEADTLNDALKAFFATSHATFVVLNNFEEYVGILTIGDVLKQLVGHDQSGELEDYTNPVAVAKRHDESEKEETALNETEQEPEAPDKTEAEVVE